MKLQKASLSKSINLSAIKTDKFKTGILTFTLTTPLSPQRFAYNTVLAGVLRRGTEKYPSLAQLNRRLDELYASSIEIRSTKTAENLSLTVTAEFLDNRYIPDSTDVLGGVLDVISQILFKPLTNDSSFDGDTVAQEARTALDYLNSEINNTRLYSLKRCHEAMYRLNDSYPSTERQKKYIEELDAQVLYRHYKELISSSLLDVFYVGDESFDTVAKKISGTFAEHSMTDMYSPQMPQCRPELPLLSLNEKMPVSQGKLTLGFGTGVCIGNSDKYIAALVFNEIFGASPASKLFMNVREKMSLCYYCSSTYNMYAGDVVVSSGVEVKNRETAESEILNQLESIRNGDITQAEFIAAKKSLENSYRQLFDNPLDLQAFYGTRGMFGISDTIEGTIEKIKNVTLKDITSIARNVHLDTVFFVEGTADTTDTEEEDYE